MGFNSDEYRRPEIQAYNESRRTKTQEPSPPRRRFIVEQEAARLKMYSLITQMNTLGIWGVA